MKVRAQFLIVARDEKTNAPVVIIGELPVTQAPPKKA